MENQNILNFSSFSEQKAMALFGLDVQNKPLKEWNEWLESSKKIEVSSREQEDLDELAYYLELYVRGWNEEELRIKFIGPLINLVRFDNYELRVAYFAERAIQVKYDKYIIKGITDGMVATGIFEPTSPFFFIHEYKREKDNSGDAAGQLLSSMCAANILNQQLPEINLFSKSNIKLPPIIYGLYIIGRFWFFMTMKEQKYYISKAYDAGEVDDLMTIFRLLKAQKQIIFEFVKQNN